MSLVYVADLGPHYKRCLRVAIILQHLIREYWSNMDASQLVFTEPLQKMIGIFRPSRGEIVAYHFIYFLISKDEFHILFPRVEIDFRKNELKLAKLVNALFVANAQEVTVELACCENGDVTQRAQERVALALCSRLMLRAAQVIFTRGCRVEGDAADVAEILDLLL
eukprot:IDg7835t1